MEDIRAYSFLTIKSIDDERREITGIATTPDIDAVGDVVDPMGGEYTLPLPFLKGHDHNQPIGEVYWAKKSKDGIEIKARIAKVDEASPLAARLTEAWHLIKSGLVKGLSIGFRPMEYNVIESTGGLHYTRWRMFEISAVTVPANHAGQITNIKSLKSFDDPSSTAAIGKDAKPAVKGKSSGVTGTKPTIKLSPKEAKTMSISEKIKQFKDEVEAKTAKRLELANKSAEAGETFSEAEQEEFDTLTQDIEGIEKHITRLELAEKAALATAKPVTEKAGQSEKGATEARKGLTQIRVTTPLDKGIAFARLARCKALSQVDHMPAYEIANALYPDDQRISNILKSAVSAATTTQATWAAPLVPEESGVFADFAEFLRPMTILGKFGTDGIPSLRRIPFRTRLISQTSGGAGYWVGEGAPKPLTKFDFAGTSLLPLKVANIAVCTMELLRDSSPSAEMLVRDGLAAALRERLDIDFVDINKAATSDSPASITNNITRVTSGGSTSDDIRCDVNAVMAAFIAANNPPTTGVWIMSATTALALSMMVNALGQREFPGVSMSGGTFAGLPVIVSEYVPSDSTGSFVILVNASDIYLGDEGGINVKMSDQASLQMLDSNPAGAGAPTNNSATPTATQLVSMFQTNSVAFLAERTINWARRRETAVGVIDGVNWGACAAS